MATTIELTRGDSRNLQIENLRDSFGNPDVFLSTDRVRFTLKRSRAQDDSKAVISLSSVTGGINLDIGASTGTIIILAGAWAGFAIDHPTLFWGDVELNRQDAPQNDVTTIWEQQILVIPDVTLTPLT